MNPGDADVVNRFHATAHDFGRDAGFFGHGNIRGPGGHDQDVAVKVRPSLLNDDDSGRFVVDRASIQLHQAPGGLRRDPRRQQRGARFQQPARDGDDLLGGFAFTEDDLGKALPESAVMVHGGEAQIFEGKRPQALEDGRDRCLPRLQARQQFLKSRLIHVVYEQSVV